MVKRLPAMWGTWVQSLGWEDPLEKKMATHSNTLAWKIPWMEEPGRLQSTGSQRVGHDWATPPSFLSLNHIYYAARSLVSDSHVFTHGMIPIRRVILAFERMHEKVGKLPAIISYQLLKRQRKAEGLFQIKEPWRVRTTKRVLSWLEKVPTFEEAL